MWWICLISKYSEHKTVANICIFTVWVKCCNLLHFCVFFLSPEHYFVIDVWNPVVQSKHVDVSQHIPTIPLTALYCGTYCYLSLLSNVPWAETCNSREAKFNKTLSEFTLQFFVCCNSKVKPSPIRRRSQNNFITVFTMFFCSSHNWFASILSF